MADTIMSRKWRMRFWYVVLILALLYLQLLPLQTVPRSWTGPDLIIVFTVVWSIRRPEYVPALLVAVMILLVDFVLLRPPGVMAAILVLARQALMRQGAGLRDATFFGEWMVAAAALVSITLANRIFLAVFLVDQPPLGMSLMALVVSIIAYPAIVLVSLAAFGVRKAAPGESDAVAGAT